MTQCNEARRKEFRKIFWKQPFGILDTEKLKVIGKTKTTEQPIKLSKGTLTAFLRELHREGLVDHKYLRGCTHGFPIDVPVWSRIK